ncbi:MAG TPA: transglycosylase SLT domain-containing protein [Gemmatirosa sp.]|nr:transglycosylase SLT domain-containing protein [Gemmatirosa sp.]
MRGISPRSIVRSVPSPILTCVRRLACLAALVALAGRGAQAQQPAAPADTMHGVPNVTSTANTTTSVSVGVVEATALESAREAARAARRDSLAADSAAFADSVRQVTRWLVANGAPEHRARPVARAVMTYSRMRGIDPLLVVGVIGVENAELVTRSRSRVGARGVMQVMPFWLKDIPQCGTDMHDVRVNVCLGTAVLRIALDASTSVREALLRYNGCVRTPGCSRYATAVFGRAGHAVLMTRLDEPAPTTLVARLAARTPSRGERGERAERLDRVERMERVAVVE